MPEVPGIPGVPASPGKPGVPPIGTEGSGVPLTETFTSIPSSPSVPSLLAPGEPGTPGEPGMPGIGEPPAGIDVVLSPWLDDGRPAVDEELLDELREPGREGIDGEDEDEELGIDGIEEDDDEDDALGIDGDDEDDEEEPGIDGADDGLELEEDDGLGIEGEELLELELLVLSHPPRIRLSADIVKTVLIAGRLVAYRNGVRMLFPPQLQLLRNRQVIGFTRPIVKPGRLSSDFSGRWSTPGEK